MTNKKSQSFPFFRQLTFTPIFLAIYLTSHQKFALLKTNLLLKEKQKQFEYTLFLNLKFTQITSESYTLIIYTGNNSHFNLLLHTFFWNQNVFSILYHDSCLKLQFKLLKTKQKSCVFRFTSIQHTWYVFFNHIFLPFQIDQIQNPLFSKTFRRLMQHLNLYRYIQHNFLLIY